MLHECTILQEYAEAIVDGSKKFEIRAINPDQPFQVGDELLLHVLDPGSWYRPSLRTDKIECKQTLRCLITYVFEGGKYGVSENYAVLSIEILDIDEDCWGLT